MRPLRMFVLALGVVLVAASSALTHAQNVPKCSPATVIQTANALKASGSDKTDMNALLKLARDIDAANRSCNGLKFADKSAKLIGPIDLPAGIYKTTLSTLGAFAATLRVFSGACYAGEVSNTALYSVLTGEAMGGADALIISGGCRLAIQTSKVTSNWTLEIVQLE